MLQLNTTYKISFMCQKNIFSKDIFCEKVHAHSQFVTTTCHGHMTQSKKITPCCGYSCQYQNFTTSGRHYDMSKTCQQHFQLRHNWITILHTKSGVHSMLLCGGLQNLMDMCIGWAQTFHKGSLWHCCCCQKFHRGIETKACRAMPRQKVKWT